MQLAWPMAPCALPAGHDRHVCAPLVGLYLPNVQAVQAFASLSLKYPAAQGVQDTAPGSEVKEPAGQEKHVS